MIDNEDDDGDDEFLPCKLILAMAQCSGSKPVLLYVEVKLVISLAVNIILSAVV